MTQHAANVATSGATGVVMRPLLPADMAEVSHLHERVFGPGRYARTAYRVREGAPKGTPLLSQYCRCVALGARLVGSLNLTKVAIGGCGDVLLLGPIAVDPEFASRGFGTGMINDALDAARKDGVKLVLLVGDAPYYARMGFTVVPAGQIMLPGPVNPERLLAIELEPGVLATYRGGVVAR